MPDRPDHVVRAVRLEKRYPDGEGIRCVLDAVDIAVEPGSVVGLQGPSGCGKSTLLKVLAGLIRPDAGSVTLVGNTLDYAQPREIARARRAHIGLLSQDYSLLERESVHENVALPLMFGPGRPGRRQRVEMTRQAIDAAALSVNPERRVWALSGGERQRVAIARALVRDPLLVVADEPTASLDAGTTQAVVATLRAVAARGAGVILATHDPRVAQACDKVYQFAGDGTVGERPSAGGRADAHESTWPDFR